MDVRVCGERTGLICVGSFGECAGLVGALGACLKEFLFDNGGMGDLGGVRQTGCRNESTDFATGRDLISTLAINLCTDVFLALLGANFGV